MGFDERSQEVYELLLRPPIRWVKKRGEGKMGTHKNAWLIAGLLAGLAGCRHSDQQKMERGAQATSDAAQNTAAGAVEATKNAAK
jgi:hypothetical protein